MNTKELLRLYTLNSQDIYLVYETLLNQLVKRFEAKKPVTLEHLEKCSTMYLIARMAARKVQELEGKSATILDKRAFRHNLAAEIIEDSKFLATIPY